MSVVSNKLNVDYKKKKVYVKNIPQTQKFSTKINSETLLMLIMLYKVISFYKTYVNYKKKVRQNTIYKLFYLKKK